MCDDNCSPVSIQDPIALSIRFSMEMFLSKELDLEVLNYCPIFRQECGIRNRFSYRFKAYCIVYVFVENTKWLAFIVNKGDFAAKAFSLSEPSKFM